MREYCKMSCSICLEKFTLKLRKEIKCQYCPEASCVQCLKQYLLSSTEDPHCHSCKRVWTNDFMNANFPFTFRGNTLRIHRRDILVSLERSRLPAMQVFVEAKRNMNEAIKVQSEMHVEITKITIERNALGEKKDKARCTYDYNMIRNTDAATIKSLKMDYLNKRRTYLQFKRDKYAPALDVYTTLCRQVERYKRAYYTGRLDDTPQDENHEERRQFHMKCPANDCRGFISQTYICGTCTKKTCSDCIEVLEEGHVCKPESVESAKAIKKETRACPKCATRIFKIDGCDQMWCTVEGCNTAFSWNTGQVVSGRVHNPHYYEWLRQNNGGNPIQREVGDVECGGLPEVNNFVRRSRYINLPDSTRIFILSVFRCLYEIEAMHMYQYPMTMHANANKDINVQYLMNEIDEATWKKKLEMKEMAFIRRKEIGQILQTFITAGTDILRAIYQKLPASSLPSGTQIHPEDEEWVSKVGIPNIISLREYTSNALLTLGSTMRMAVPDISAEFNWVPARAYYNKKSLTRMETIEEETV